MRVHFDEGLQLLSKTFSKIFYRCGDNSRQPKILRVFPLVLVISWKFGPCQYKNRNIRPKIHLKCRLGGVNPFFGSLKFYDYIISDTSERPPGFESRKDWTTLNGLSMAGLSIGSTNGDLTEDIKAQYIYYTKRKLMWFG